MQDSFHLPQPTHPIRKHLYFSLVVLYVWRYIAAPVRPLRCNSEERTSLFPSQWNSSPVLPISLHPCSWVSVHTEEHVCICVRSYVCIYIDAKATLQMDIIPSREQPKKTKKGQHPAHPQPQHRMKTPSKKSYPPPESIIPNLHILQATEASNQCARIDVNVCMYIGVGNPSGA